MTSAEPSVPALWAALGQPERAACIALALPTMRRAPLLLRLRWRARSAGLANRIVRGKHAAGLEWCRWMIEQGKIGEG